MFPRAFDAQVKQSVIQFLKFAGQEKLKAFTDKNQCYAGQVGAPQMLYITPGWAFAELTKDMSIGVKAPLFIDVQTAADFFECAANSKGEGAADQARIAFGYTQAMANAQAAKEKKSTQEEKPDA